MSVFDNLGVHHSSLGTVHETEKPVLKKKRFVGRNNGIYVEINMNNALALSS